MDIDGGHEGRTYAVSKLKEPFNGITKDAGYRCFLSFQELSDFLYDGNQLTREQKDEILKFTRIVNRYAADPSLHGEVEKDGMPGVVWPVETSTQLNDPFFGELVVRLPIDPETGKYQYVQVVRPCVFASKEDVEKYTELIDSE